MAVTPHEVVTQITDLQGGMTDQEYLNSIRDGVPEEWIISPVSVQAADLDDLYSDAD